jgi:hypothetical protein
VVPVLPDLVRGARTIRAKISDELAGIPAFRSLVDITLRLARQSGAARDHPRQEVARRSHGGDITGRPGR